MVQTKNIIHYSIYIIRIIIHGRIQKKFFRYKCYKEKVEVLRKLDKETKPWLKCQKNDEMSIFGQRI